MLAGMHNVTGARCALYHHILLHLLALLGHQRSRKLLSLSCTGMHSALTALQT
jgi:hypothetical protein